MKWYQEVKSPWNFVEKVYNLEAFINVWLGEYQMRNIKSCLQHVSWKGKIMYYTVAVFKREKLITSILNQLILSKHFSAYHILVLYVSAKTWWWEKLMKSKHRLASPWICARTLAQQSFIRLMMLPVDIITPSLLQTVFQVTWMNFVGVNLYESEILCIK